MIRIIPRSKWWYAMATSLVSPNVWNPPPVEHDSKSTDTTKKVVFEMMHIWKKTSFCRDPSGPMSQNINMAPGWLWHDEIQKWQKWSNVTFIFSHDLTNFYPCFLAYGLWYQIFLYIYIVLSLTFFPQLGGFKPAEEYIFIDSDHDAISRENETCLQLPTSKYARYV